MQIPKLNRLQLELSQNLKRLTLENLRVQTDRAFQKEKLSTLDLLLHLLEVSDRRAYAVWEFDSLWSYIRSHGYSESAASERNNAVRLLRAVPELKVALATGSISLTSASAVQRFIQAEEKETRTKVSLEKKKELIQEVAGKTKREVEQVLLSKSIHPEVHEHKERFKPVSEQFTKIEFYGDAHTLELITRIKELKGQAPLKELFEKVMEDYLKRHDLMERELRKNPKPSTPISHKTSAVLPAKVTPSKTQRRYLSLYTRQTVWKKAGGCCQAIENGKKCESRYRLEIEHLCPVAAGGTNDLENLTLLCRAPLLSGSFFRVEEPSEVLVDGESHTAMLLKA